MSEEKKQFHTWPYVRPTNPPNSDMEPGDFFIYIGTVKPNRNTVCWGTCLTKEQVDEEELAFYAEQKARMAWKSWNAILKDKEELERL